MYVWTLYIKYNKYILHNERVYEMGYIDLDKNNISLLSHGTKLIPFLLQAQNDTVINNIRVSLK